MPPSQGHSMALSLGWLSALGAGLVFTHVLLKLCFPYFWRDLFFLLKVIRYGVKLEVFKLTSRVCTVLDRFIQQAQRIPDKPFVIYEGQSHTYGAVESRSNRLAHVFRDTMKLEKGDCVAVLMSNEPDFLCVWFGLAKVGCSIAFLNTNIKSRSLLHCFNCCGARTLVVGAGKTLSPGPVLHSALIQSCLMATVVTQGPTCSFLCLVNNLIQRVTFSLEMKRSSGLCRHITLSAAWYHLMMPSCLYNHFSNNNDSVSSMRYFSFQNGLLSAV